MKRISRTKSIAPLFVAALAMVAVPGCKKDEEAPATGEGAEATGETPAEEGPLKVGFLLKTMQEERYQRDKKAFIDKAQSLGAEVLFDSANNNEQTQLSKFETMLAQGAKVIVLQPVNTGTAGNMVKMANEEGVRVVGYDSMLVNGPLDVQVMQDSWAVGKLQGEAMVEWLKAKNDGKVEGKVALIKGQPGDSNANAMSEGALTIINENEGLELVAEESHEGWSSDKAMATAENVLTKYENGVDAFIANNSGMARGVIAALQNQGLDDATKVFVAGSDADLVNIQYVAQGKQAVEIWKKITPLAETAAEIAVTLAKSPDKPVTELVEADRTINNGAVEVPTIVTPVVLVTKDNVEDTVVAGEFYTKEQVFGAEAE
ncbi:substrate-binding domain-containing protein [Haliangium ochraceum]|uniref:D-xylose transporter subunit XylF n=1 Tax=Haliangium ochraceum (strain DSM 14365 / JCM 11303 / SMP-2) TaxID=502025 RepID=D0LRU4_HALO1|nr:substrate-binding domain-containing protein [Haliangium ochraceum]ACY19086.1 D-xylose transporter subunit XylF [Haliangium ochraceum DSM 14365]